MSAQRGSNETWTVLKMLEWITGYFEKQGFDSPRYEAEVLLEHALNMQRIMIYANFDRPLQSSELDVIRPMVKRRGKYEPMAYITGSRGFWTIDLKTDARALIPRPDTEALVEAALEKLDARAKERADHRVRVIDIGTGSGAIALAIAHDREQAEVAAVDISAPALSLARENAEALDLSERVTFFEADLFAGLPAEWVESLDIVVSNPPYVSRDEEEIMGKGVKAFEPEGALFAEDDGLAIIKRLVPEAYSALAPGGWLLCEIGFAQGSVVKEIFSNQGFVEVSVRKDLGRKDRVVLGQKPATA